VSPEAVFYTLVKEFDFDFGKFAQFKKKAKELRKNENIPNEKFYFPKRYRQLINELYEENLITAKRKDELLLKDFQK